MLYNYNTIVTVMSSIYNKFIKKIFLGEVSKRFESKFTI